MAANGLTLTGGNVFRSRLESARAKVPNALKSATDESLELLEAAAKKILDDEIYSKPHDADDYKPDKTDGDSLYASFVREVISVGGGQIAAQLLNTSDHALFVEKGTEKNTPHRFMERALYENRDKVRAIFRREVETLLR